MEDISNDLCIGAYIHCGACVEDFKKGAPETRGNSPAAYSRYSLGWTPMGLQIWCNRHDCNIAHIDFEGAQHPANTTSKKRSALKSVK